MDERQDRLTCRLGRLCPYFIAGATQRTARPHARANISLVVGKQKEAMARAVQVQ